jgi:biotin transport system substrate-specific component
MTGHNWNSPGDIMIALPKSDTQFATLAPFTTNSVLRQGALALFGSWMLAGLSQIELGAPVPMTLQTLGVMLIGLTFGARLAFASVAAYLVQGAMGLPVFAGGAGGAAHFYGPTGGYLAGFLLAATLIGYLADKGVTRSWPGTIVALLAGSAAIYALGLPWLGSIFGYDNMLAYGFTPFVVGDTIKLVLAALIGKGVLKGASTFAKL